MNTTTITSQTSLETYFDQFRHNIIGQDQTFDSPYGKQRIIYADWIASGRMYAPIEKLLNEELYPYVGNTHTETTITGSSMTLAYHRAKSIIKEHVNANEHDILISSNSGMTGVVNKLQRILGLKIHEKFADRLEIPDHERPIVFCSHMEHHSNQTSWLETICDLEIIKACPKGACDLEHLQQLLEKYKDRKVKIATITSCSNVTGIFTPYYDIAKLMHQNEGLCFVDFACSAPYIDIDMHPTDEESYLDAIYFSPHKFLGGPSSSGILLFNQKLYSNKVPDNPGGGTVDWTNPWGNHKYYDAIEAREDGGTPSFLQTMRVALSIQLKEKMSTEKIIAREHELLEIAWPKLSSIDNLHILADTHKDRLGVISFYIEDLHYNLAVKLLNDRFGIQVRGGCSCAGTYGHYLLEVSYEKSESITQTISLGDMTNKPGWIRLSLHPTMTDEEVRFICDAIKELALNHNAWAIDYKYCNKANEFSHKDGSCGESELVEEWFSKSLV
ncbi:MAG: selenocysteine lyase/cysteine desulfurase [Saprospiraceae bacterium]|jgi:selenocysteine lyase/cysteine desulfurase